MKTLPLIVDAHQDIAWNMQMFGRDYLRSVPETRDREHGTEIPKHNGDTLLGWAEYQKGNIGIIFATLFASTIRKKEGRWDRLCYENPDQAFGLYRAQLDVYLKLIEEHPDKFILLRDFSEVERFLKSRDDLSKNGNSDLPIGLLILMESAEAIREVGELESWWQLGVRIIGPAWSGNKYCGGTLEPGPLTEDGYQLLDEMANLGFILDLSHMDEPAALQALDHYPGTIIATHGNAKSLLKGTSSNRHLSDKVIKEISMCDGVIGVVLFNKFLRAGWEIGDQRDLVALDAVIEQIDYMCQITGDSQHVGFGTDFDGGFGLQSVPIGFDTIADLHKLSELLQVKGYNTDDVAHIMGKNWVNLLRRGLPI